MRKKHKFTLLFTIVCLVTTSFTQTLFATESITEQEDLPRTQQEVKDGYQSRQQYVRSQQVNDLYSVRNDYIKNILEKDILRQQIVDYALSWVGVTPYVWWTERYWGNSLTLGTDCSGFVHLIYANFGIALPTGSAMYQNNVGYHVSYDELLPGDIIVYEYGSHVAMYVGNGQCVHCSSPEVGTVTYQIQPGIATAYVRVID